MGSSDNVYSFTGTPPPLDDDFWTAGSSKYGSSSASSASTKDRRSSSMSFQDALLRPNSMDPTNYNANMSSATRATEVTDLKLSLTTIDSDENEKKQSGGMLGGWLSWIGL